MKFWAGETPNDSVKIKHNYVMDSVINYYKEDDPQIKYKYKELFLDNGAFLYLKMEFEFDTDKSEANREKHGISFNEAKVLWRDVDALELFARNEGEVRKMLIAERAGKLWTAIFTERGDKVRIISVRRARKNEEDLYEQQ